MRADRARCGKQVLPLQLRSPDDDRPRGGAECLRVYQSHENGPSRTLFSCEPTSRTPPGMCAHRDSHMNVCSSPHCLRLVSSSTMCTCNKWCASELQRAHCIPGARTADRSPRARTSRTDHTVPSVAPSGRSVEAACTPRSHRDLYTVPSSPKSERRPLSASIVACGALRALTFARASRAVARSSSSQRVKQPAPRRSSCPACPRRSRRSHPSRGLRRRP